MQKMNRLAIIILFCVLTVAMWVQFFIERANADDGQYKAAIPFGKTTSWIQPYYTFKPNPMVVAFTVKPKNKNYCPPETGDYQCPMDQEGNKIQVKPEVISLDHIASALQAKDPL